MKVISSHSGPRRFCAKGAAAADLTLGFECLHQMQSRKSGTIRESIQASGVPKAHIYEKAPFC